MFSALHAQAFQIGTEQRRVGIHVQDARNSDAQLRAPFHQRDAVASSGGPGARGDWIGDAFRVARAPHFAGGHLHQVWIGGLGGIEMGFNAAHGRDIFHRAFFAAGDDHALLTGLERHLGGEGRWRPAFGNSGLQHLRSEHRGKFAGRHSCRSGNACLHCVWCGN